MEGVRFLGSGDGMRPTEVRGISTVGLCTWLSVSAVLTCAMIRSMITSNLWILSRTRGKGSFLALNHRSALPDPICEFFPLRL